MAKYLNMAAKQVIIATWALAYGISNIATAQTLIDPTRPPAVASGEPVAEQAATGPVLQSVLISPHRVEAIINGKTVKVGDKIGEAKVVRITEDQVLLRNGQELQVLKLFPNIEKQSTHGASTLKRTTSGNKGKS